MKSKSARALPSISTIRPFSIRREDGGSSGDSMAAMPASGHSVTKPS